MNELEQAFDDRKHGKYDACFPVIRRYAEAGDAEAQFELARSLEMECGLSEDIPAAIEWYRKAHANGHPHAALALALMLDPDNILYTEKIQKSAEEAAKFYRLAFEEYQRRAAQGIYEFMYSLMNCYASGWGTEVNIGEAQRLHEQLAAVGYNPYSNRCEEELIEWYRVKREEMIAWNRAQRKEQTQDG